MEAVTVLLLFAAVAWLVLLLDARRRTAPPLLQAAPTPFNLAVLSRCPSLHRPYTPTPGLTNGHAETVLQALLRRPPPCVEYAREMLLVDNGKAALALDWLHEPDATDGQHKQAPRPPLPADAPVLVLLPGLTGGSCDSYVQHAAAAARAAGMRPVVFNSRGTCGSPVMTPQFYSASFTGDLRAVVEHVAARHPGCLLFAAGWSLGGNILVNFLGEEGTAARLAAAVSLCNPFELAVCDTHIRQGFARLYDANLAASMRALVLAHTPVWRGWTGPAGARLPEAVAAARSIREFDEAVTLHSFGWRDVDEYYARSSSSLRVPHVAVPLLCIQAANDPIAPAVAIPCDALAANPHCVLAVTPTGGHLGWAAWPGAPWGAPWTDAPMMEWLLAVQLELHKAAAAAARGGTGAEVAQVQQEPVQHQGMGQGREKQQQRQQAHKRRRQPPPQQHDGAGARNDRGDGKGAPGQQQQPSSPAPQLDHAVALANARSLRSWAL